MSLLLLLVALSAPPRQAGSATIAGTVGDPASSAGVVLYLRNGPGEHSGEGRVAVLDQEGKVFIPHVMAVLKGTVVRVKNSDPLLHNVHAYRDKRTVCNVAMPVQGSTKDLDAFRKPGTYLILCDVHTEMSAYIVVLENPFFAMPGQDGRYAIRDVLAGEHVLVKYDPELREEVEKKVVVAAEGVIVDF
jgi:plastocyanin